MEPSVVPVKKSRATVSPVLKAYRQFIHDNCSKMPGATPQERLKQCAAKYRSQRDGKKEAKAESESDEEA